MGCVVMGPPHASEPPTLVHSGGYCFRASRVPSRASTRVSTSPGKWPWTVNDQEPTAVGVAPKGAAGVGALTGGLGTADFGEAG